MIHKPRTTEWEDRLADAIFRIADASDLNEDAYQTAISAAIDTLAVYANQTGVDIRARVHAQDKAFWENFEKQNR